MANHTEHVLRLTGCQYNALLTGARLLANALETRTLSAEFTDILTDSGTCEGLTADEAWDLGDMMQAGELER